MIAVVHSLNAEYSVVMILLKQLGLIGHYNYMKMQKKYLIDTHFSSLNQVIVCVYTFTNT